MVTGDETEVVEPRKVTRRERATRIVVAGEPLLRIKDVAHWLGVTRQTVRTLTELHGLKYVKVGRELRFRRQWVEQWIDRRDR